MDVPLTSNGALEEERHLDIERYKEEQEDYIAAVKNYNNSINEHLPCYTQMKPLHDVLVRIYLREPKTVTYDGTTFNLPETSSKDMVEIQRRAGSGDRYTQNLEATPYKWQIKAVVVNCKPNDYVKVGDEIIIPYLDTQAMIRADNSRYMTYTAAFVHPSYGDIEPPTDYMSPHFGYALLSVGYIKALV